MAKIFVAIPTYDKKVDIEIMAMFARLPGEYPEHQFGLDYIASSLITDARNYLTRRFLETDFDWLYFWDADLAIRDVSFLGKMLETASSLKADIVGGPYRFKNNEELYVAGNNHKGIIKNFSKKDLKEPMIVDCVGTGSMLISRKAIETIGDPWFSFIELKGKTIPEDFHFCKLARDKGLKVAIDPRFRTAHFGYAFWEHLPNNS